MLIYEWARNVPSDVESTGAALRLGTIEHEELALSNFPQIIGILVDLRHESVELAEEIVQ